MYSCVPFMRRRMAVRVQKQGASVVLRWNGWAPETPVDPTTGARLGEPTAMSETVKGWVYLVKITSAVRLFEEVEDGDAIVDLPAATVIEGRESLTFEIQGQTWRQKDVGDKLTTLWDALVGGQRIGRTLLLKLTK